MTISRFNPKPFMIAMLVAAPLFIACKDKATPAEGTINTPQEATLEQKKQALQNVAPTSTQTTNNTSSSGNLALNPAHGQPGHDCAIPVGAPLDGSGASSSTASPIQASGGSGINPAHGQPGHRCDIKVGDPL
ncbi:hypothetical protein [Aequorivita antarctica]|uniref:Uncharacterized protein n=1 Tax=Aequorivita antarctica TaxID=153266 RepID=A0A5C6Z5V7_9FLAO|nr:hypothetical protein [Aequorivita antarctica]TXD74891.1 hypothetical protein ESU54_01490 [Aequorivita antarctica]SRX72384.1 hypothetical protein AEQU3_00218 [Aequorivita antarctica]